MPTNPYHRRSSSAARSVLLALGSFVAVLAHAPTSHAAPPASPENDVNRLLRLLGQNIRVGSVEVGRPVDPLWIKDVRKLQSSANPAVAKTARAAEESIKKREEALKMIETTQAKNQELSQETHAMADEIAERFGLGGPSDSDIDAARQSGQISATEAEAYSMRNAAKERALLELGALELQKQLNAYATDKAAAAIRKRAEVLEADAVAENLLPALRARAGAKRDNPPLRIAAGLFGREQDDVCMLPSIISTASEPLTNLTLLMEFRVPPGHRRAVAFIPTLEPGRGIQIVPVPYDFKTLVDPKKTSPTGTASVVRYSVWCDQFSYEGEEVPFTPGTYAYAAYCSIATQKGRSYDFIERRIGGDRAAYRFEHTIYRLEFTDMTPEQTTFRVKGNLSLFDDKDRDKPLKVAPFEGILEGVKPVASETNKLDKKPPPKGENRKPSIFDKAHKGLIIPDKSEFEKSAPPARGGSRGVNARPGEVLLSITSGSEQSEVNLYLSSSGAISWVPTTGILRDRIVNSTEQILQVRLAVSVMREATQLALSGKKDEAAKVLKDYIATNPGDVRVAQAQQQLKQLDWLAAQGASLKQSIESRPKDPKATSAMGDFGKGLGGFGGLQPPGSPGGLPAPGKFGPRGNNAPPSDAVPPTGANPALPRGSKFPDPPTLKRP